MTPLADQKFYEFSEVFPGKIPVCARTGRKLISEGKIGIIRVEGRVLIPSGSLEEFLRASFVPAKVKVPPMKLVTADELIARAKAKRAR